VDVTVDKHPSALTAIACHGFDGIAKGQVLTSAPSDQSEPATFYLNGVDWVRAMLSLRRSRREARETL